MYGVWYVASRTYEDVAAAVAKADFFIADDRGTHRLVGVYWRKEEFCHPIVSCVFPRHELIAAKQAAWQHGKRIFYDSALSAVLFHDYSTGDMVSETSVEKKLVPLYLSFIKTTGMRL